MLNTKEHESKYNVYRVKNIKFVEKQRVLVFTVFHSIDT